MQFYANPQFAAGGIVKEISPKIIVSRGKRAKGEKGEKGEMGKRGRVGFHLLFLKNSRSQPTITLSPFSRFPLFPKKSPFPFFPFPLFPFLIDY
ncbi:MAG TPA: hypothetical protein DDW51_29090 [Cyanobacteria bacterium UBA11367]|nr:hypothetical protein [Cyanobacteria bacterium UBA11367]